MSDLLDEESSVEELVNDSDLSDEDWERVKHEFLALWPRFGTLWQSLAEANVEIDDEVVACDEECCRINSFVPVEYLTSGNDATLAENGAVAEDDEVESEPSSSEDSDESGSTVVAFDVSFNPSPSATAAENKQEPPAFVSMSTTTAKSPIMDDHLAQPNESPLAFATLNDKKTSHKSNPSFSSSKMAKHSPTLSHPGSRRSNSSSRSSTSTRVSTLTSPDTDSPFVFQSAKKTPRRLVIEDDDDDDDDDEESSPVRRFSCLSPRWDMSPNSTDSEGEPEEKPLSIRLDASMSDDDLGPRKKAGRRSSVRSSLASSGLDSDKSVDKENHLSSNKTTSSSWQLGDESSEEEEWAGDESLAAPAADDDSIDKLADKASRLIILSSDDDEDSLEDDGVEIVSLPTSAKPTESKAAFVRKRESIAADIFADYDKRVFGGRLTEAGVTLNWSKKLRTTAGLTRMKRGPSRFGADRLRVASIDLSTKILDAKPRLQATLMHEMCHAAAWIIDDNCKPAHGKIFKKWAKRAMTTVPSITVSTTHNYEIAFKYAWQCQTPKCGVIIKRHSRSVKVDKHVCGRCKGRLVEIEVPTQRNALLVKQTPRQKAPPTAYALFVKEKSASVRSRLESLYGGTVSQPQVMKECARLWHEQKPSAS